MLYKVYKKYTSKLYFLINEDVFYTTWHQCSTDVYLLYTSVLFEGLEVYLLYTSLLL